MVGLLFLDDLSAFAPWIADRGNEWARAHGDGELLPPTVYPPPALVVVARRETAADALKTFRPWLRLARRIALVVEGTLDLRVAGPAMATGNVVSMDEAHGDLPAAVETAARRLDGDGTWKAWTPTRHRPAAPPGPWTLWALPRWSPSHSLGLPAALRHLSAGLCAPHGRPSLLDAVVGERIDLTTGLRPLVPGLQEPTNVGSLVAALPDGDRWLRAVPPARELGWQVNGAAPSLITRDGFGMAIGVEPGGVVAWTGGRSMFTWRVLTDEGPVAWTPSSHGWPDGHAKKLYGYEDNEPLWVHLAPDASACLSVYEHDALVTSGLPLRWKAVGGLAVAVRDYGEPRAVLFERADGDEGFPGDPSQGDEDARDAFPTVCLGPGSARRYTVGLDRTTWRVRGGAGVRLGGPDQGWVVFDEAHEPVHRGEGRLLAGWHRWLVVLRDGELVRVDLASIDLADVERLGPPGREITAAVAVPGTPNVVLLSMDEDRAWLRLV